MSNHLIHILFPPQFEPFEPYLSGAYLKSLLAVHGIPASVFDANLDFYDWLIESARNGPTWSTSPHEDFDYLRASVDTALDLIRTTPQSLLQYRWAINIIDQYLHAVSPIGVKIGLTYLKVGNRHSSDDLQAYLGQDDNLFRLFFERASSQILGSPNVDTYLFSLVVLDQLPAALTFAREIKRRRTGARVIIGGPLVSRLHRQLAAIPWIAETFDAIAPGEAYRILPALLGLAGTYSRHISPDFSDYDLDRYWSCRRVLPYLVAHGCKWGKCTFCSHHLTYDGYRSSGMTDVIADLERLFQQHRPSYITFCDEYLTPAQLDALSIGLVERKIDIKWSTFARPEPEFRDRNFLARLYDAGCRMLMFGLESGSQRILKAMKKGTRLEHFRPILQACKEANIAVRYDFMVGFPGETEDDTRATYEFVRENRDVIDTPFSSYAVAAFELRSDIPVQQEAARFGIRSRKLLRGDLDDQYEFDDASGLSEQSRAEWRARLIQFGKVELDMELVCPQNKTHQLILKDLYDRGLFHLPVCWIDEARLSGLTARLAPGVCVWPEHEKLFVSNQANGGRLEIGPQLVGVFDVLANGVNLASAFRVQGVWDEKTFAQFVSFLYRNDHVQVSSATASAVSGASRWERINV